MDEINAKDENNFDFENDVCPTCLGDGVLLVCDRCPRSFHVDCVLPKLDRIPESKWVCIFCLTSTEIFNLESNPGEFGNREAAICFRIVCELSLSFSDSYIKWPRSTAFSGSESPSLCKIRQNLIDFKYANTSEFLLQLRKFSLDGLRMFKKAGRNAKFFRGFNVCLHNLLKQWLPDSIKHKRSGRVTATIGGKDISRNDATNEPSENDRRATLRKKVHSSQSQVSDSRIPAVKTSFRKTTEKIKQRRVFQKVGARKSQSAVIRRKEQLLATCKLRSLQKSACTPVFKLPKFRIVSQEKDRKKVASSWEVYRRLMLETPETIYLNTVEEEQQHEQKETEHKSTSRTKRSVDSKRGEVRRRCFSMSLRSSTKSQTANEPEEPVRCRTSASSSQTYFINQTKTKPVEFFSSSHLATRQSDIRRKQVLKPNSNDRRKMIRIGQRLETPTKHESLILGQKVESCRQIQEAKTQIVKQNLFLSKKMYTSGILSENRSIHNEKVSIKKIKFQPTETGQSKISGQQHLPSSLIEKKISLTLENIDSSRRPIEKLFNGQNQIEVEPLKKCEKAETLPVEATKANKIQHKENELQHSSEDVTTRLDSQEVPTEDITVLESEKEIDAGTSFDVNKKIFLDSGSKQTNEQELTMKQNPDLIPSHEMTFDAMTRNVMMNDTMTSYVMTNDTMTSDVMTNDTMRSDVVTNDTMTSDVVTNDTMTRNVMTNDTMTSDVVTNDTMTNDIMISYAMTDDTPTTKMDLGAFPETKMEKSNAETTGEKSFLTSDKFMLVSNEDQTAEQSFKDEVRTMDIDQEDESEGIELNICADDLIAGEFDYEYEETDQQVPKVESCETPDPAKEAAANESTENSASNCVAKRVEKSTKEPSARLSSRDAESQDFYLNAFLRLKNSCFRTWVKGNCISENCKFDHKIPPDSIFDYYNMIKRVDPSKLPVQIRYEIPQCKMEALFGVYTIHKDKLVDARLRTQFFEKLLEDFNADPKPNLFPRIDDLKNELQIYFEMEVNHLSPREFGVLARACENLISIYLKGFQMSAADHHLKAIKIVSFFMFRHGLLLSEDFDYGNLIRVFVSGENGVRELLPILEYWTHLSNFILDMNILQTIVEFVCRVDPLSEEAQPNDGGLHPLENVCRIFISLEMRTIDALDPALKHSLISVCQQLKENPRFCWANMMLIDFESVPSRRPEQFTDPILCGVAEFVINRKFDVIADLLFKIPLTDPLKLSQFYTTVIEEMLCRLSALDILHFLELFLNLQNQYPLSQRPIHRAFLASFMATWICFFHMKDKLNLADEMMKKSESYGLEPWKFSTLHSPKSPTTPDLSTRITRFESAIVCIKVAAISNPAKSLEILQNQSAVIKNHLNLQNQLQLSKELLNLMMPCYQLDHKTDRLNVVMTIFSSWLMPLVRQIDDLRSASKQIFIDSSFNKIVQFGILSHMNKRDPDLVDSLLKFLDVYLPDTMARIEPLTPSLNFVTIRGLVYMFHTIRKTRQALRFYRIAKTMTSGYKTVEFETSANLVSIVTYLTSSEMEVAILDAANELEGKTDAPLLQISVVPEECEVESSLEFLNRFKIRTVFSALSSLESSINAFKIKVVKKTPGSLWVNTKDVAKLVSRTKKSE